MKSFSSMKARLQKLTLNFTMKFIYLTVEGFELNQHQCFHPEDFCIGACTSQVWLIELFVPT